LLRNISHIHTADGLLCLIYLCSFVFVCIRLCSFVFVRPVGRVIVTPVDGSIDRSSERQQFTPGAVSEGISLSDRSLAEVEQRGAVSAGPVGQALVNRMTEMRASVAAKVYALPLIGFASQIV